MFEIKDKRLLPYQGILFGALALYLWQLNRANKAGGQTKITIDTDKLSKAAMPYVPVPPQYAGPMQEGIKKVLNVVLEKVKK